MFLKFRIKPKKENFEFENLPFEQGVATRLREKSIGRSM
jgi:hypothetical protein